MADSTENNLTRGEALEIWKCFADAGGTDKGRMVTISTWFLAFSATIIGYIAINHLEFNPFCIAKPGKAAVLAIMGFIVSGIGALVVLLYAGYTNRNWAKADEIAERYGLKDLLPNERPVVLKSRILDRLSAPRDPRTQLAPVFWLFLIVAPCIMLLDLVLLIHIIWCQFATSTVSF